MQCEVDPNMRITATTHAEWYGAPPGLFCAPKTDYPWVGFWDYSHWCKNPWADPPESCDVYEVREREDTSRMECNPPFRGVELI